jgi:CheY-like chemotaxis protein
LESHLLEQADSPARATILVIDDEEAVRGLFRAILEPIGYSIMEAANGRDGIRRFHESPTDVVITDLSMPAGEGVEVIRALRSDRPSVKILAVSGSKAEDEQLSEAQRFGADALLIKPLGVGELREAVARLLAGNSKTLWH